jgi:hypothetical protein
MTPDFGISRDMITDIAADLARRRTAAGAGS